MRLITHYTFDVGILSPTRPPVGLPSAVFSNTWLTNSEVCPATGRPEGNKRNTYDIETESIWRKERNTKYLRISSVALSLILVQMTAALLVTAAPKSFCPIRFMATILKIEKSNQTNIHIVNKYLKWDR